MNKQDIWAKVESSYKSSKKHNPKFPDHISAQAAVIGIECGKLQLAAHENKYEGRQNKQQLKDGAISTMVACIRFLENLKED